MHWKAAIAACMLGLSGCVIQPINIPIKAAFDEAAAQRMVQPGPNIVSGSALIRQNGGGVVSCAGLPVNLVPKTAYARERVIGLFGGDIRAFAPAHTMHKTFSPDPESFRQNMLVTVCDTQGRFEFSQVADGEFYVVTVITWNVANQAQGGGLLAHVKVEGGQVQRVVLSP